jgi:excisionase family DNA binding protein
MTQNVNADYVSSPQAAKILRITYVGVAQLARQGKIPAVKIANRWLIPKAFLEEFARTYEGRRGRPRKKAQFVEHPESPATIEPERLGLADAGSEIMGFRPADAAVPASDNRGDQQRGTPAFAAQLGELLPRDTCPVAGGRESDSEARQALDVGSQLGQVEEPLAYLAQPAQPRLKDVAAVSEAADSGAEAGEVLAVNADVGHPEHTPASTVQPSELEPEDAAPVPETEDSRREGDQTFAISAQVYHLDNNYDFEVYEKGEITERARLIVARLKPKIPSLPQFSFRWDYRYEHLNVDIHGVDPAAVDWWTMGKNGYTGHLPRKLGGPGHAFEANIWLPVTFVFRGRLTVSLRDSPDAKEDSSSVATTTGGLRKLWARWPTVRHSE